MAGKTIDGGEVRKITKTQRAVAIGASAAIVSLAMASPAAAQSPNDLLQNVVDVLQGGLTRLLAIIAVILMGVGCFFGIFDWRKVAMIVFGMVLVFGAAEIVSLISG